MNTVGQFWKRTPFRFSQGRGCHLNSVFSDQDKTWPQTHKTKIGAARVQHCPITPPNQNSKKHNFVDTMTVSFVI